MILLKIVSLISQIYGYLLILYLFYLFKCKISKIALTKVNVLIIYFIIIIVFMLTISYTSFFFAYNEKLIPSLFEILGWIIAALFILKYVDVRKIVNKLTSKINLYISYLMISIVTCLFFLGMSIDSSERAADQLKNLVPFYNYYENKLPERIFYDGFTNTFTDTLWDGAHFYYNPNWGRNLGYQTNLENIKYDEDMMDQYNDVEAKSTCPVN